MYKKSEVEKAALDYFGDPMVAHVWLDKYALRKGVDEFLELSPEETIVRLATELHRIECKYPNPISYDKIYSLMKGYGKFVLGGSPLFGIGNTQTISTLGNCFVVDSPLDSYGGIFKADQELAQIMKRRGGVGIDVSTLRPRRARVNNAASTSTGAVSFVNRFSNTTREVAQEGRRGALMITMNINHPDIIEFITCKDDLTKVTGANISVKVTDQFMNAVDTDTDFDLWWPGTGKILYEGSDGKISDAIRIRLKAKVLWEKLIHQAWKSAEPGILFWDRIVEESPADCYDEFKTITTNPCSELPLCAYDSCRLSAINLYQYVVNPFESHSNFDYQELTQDVIIFQRLMDDMIDLESEKILAIIDKILGDPEDNEIKRVELDLWTKIHRKLLLGRRTGLGQMGLADAGAALGLKYGNDKFIKFAKEVNKIIAVNSYKSSVIMAKERGAFPLWNLEKEVHNPYLVRVLSSVHGIGHGYIDYGRRNIANLTIAPTGSISMLAGVSSGIEPVFALSYKRKRKVTEDNPNKKFQDKQGDWWEEYTVLHPKYITWMNKNDYDYPCEIDEYTVATSPYYQACAHEIDPFNKLQIQSVIQPWIDHSISITYNLPKETTEKEVSNLYLEAWKSGLKGLTVYRDGCREGVLTIGNNESTFEQHDAPKRPKILPCDIYRIKSKGKEWTVIVGLYDNKPYEVFVTLHDVNGYTKGEVVKVSKGKYDLRVDGKSLFEDICYDVPDDENIFTRLLSTALRHGSDIEFIVGQLNKSTGDITTFSRVIARTLKKYIKNVNNLRTDDCPVCGIPLISEGGCWICHQCGYSKCM